LESSERFSATVPKSLDGFGWSKTVKTWRNRSKTFIDWF